MSTFIRIAARVALVALALLFVMPFVGVTFTGSPLLALGAAATFEVVCWIFGSALALAIESFGFKKENAAVPAALAFAAVWTLGVKLAGTLAPAVFAVAGWPAAFFAMLILLAISGVTTWRPKASQAPGTPDGK